MELTSELLEQIAFSTRSKIERHMLIVMDKSTHEEHLSQPLQTNNEQLKIAFTFLTGYNDFSILQIRIINLFPLNQSSIKMVIYKLPHRLLHTRLKV